MNKDTETLLNAINAKYRLLEPQHLRVIFGDLVDELRAEIGKANTPVFYNVQFGQQPFVLDYKNRKHVFVFNPTGSAIIMTTNDGISVTLPSQAWTNIGLEPSTAFSAASGRVVVKCTNEVTP